MFPPFWDQYFRPTSRAVSDHTAVECRFPGEFPCSTYEPWAKLLNKDLCQDHIGSLLRATDHGFHFRMAHVATW